VKEEKIQEALDIIEHLLVEIEHLQNLMEILILGFQNDSKDCEASSLYILGQYIEKIKNEYVITLMDTLENRR
jgi:FtsZ-binding cell division protein ZapB